jgi:hypothetical protein
MVDPPIIVIAFRIDWTLVQTAVNSFVSEQQLDIN